MQNDKHWFCDIIDLPNKIVAEDDWAMTERYR